MKNTYRYELHMHTAETSPCGQVPGARCAELHASAGYDGVCVTDHYFRSLLDGLPGRTPADRIRSWMSGYRAVRDEGARIGLDVLLCMELRFDGSSNDFLVYGITEELLRDHTDLYAMGPERFHAFAGRHGLFFAQAHPYRNGCAPVHPAWLHGIETFNGNPRHDSRNDQAKALAGRHPHIVPLAGSDFHQECDLASASVLLSRRVTASRDLVSLLRETAIQADRR